MRGALQGFLRGHYDIYYRSQKEESAREEPILGKNFSLFFGLLAPLSHYARGLFAYVQLFTPIRILGAAISLDLR